MCNLVKLRNNPDYYLLVATGSLVVIAIAMSICAHWLPRFPGDLNLTLLFQSIHSNTLLSVMEWVSNFTANWRSAVIVVALSLLFFWKYGKREAIMIIGAGISSLLGAVVKMLVDRPRPTADLVKVSEIIHEGSFPSGHSFFAMALFGLVAYLALTRIHRRCFRMLTFLTMLILILMVGASRVYLGAHWPSDVIGGYMFAGVVLTIFIYLDRLSSRHLPT